MNSMTVRCQCSTALPSSSSPAPLPMMKLHLSIKWVCPKAHAHQNYSFPVPWRPSGDPSVVLLVVLRHLLKRHSRWPGRRGRTSSRARLELLAVSQELVFCPDSERLRPAVPCKNATSATRQHRQRFEVMEGIQGRLMSSGFFSFLTSSTALAMATKSMTFSLAPSAVPTLAPASRPV